MQRLLSSGGRSVVYCDVHSDYMRPHCPGFEPDPDYVPATGDHCELCGATIGTETPIGILPWWLALELPADRNLTGLARELVRTARSRGTSVAAILAERFAELEASEPERAAALSPTRETFTHWGGQVVQTAGDGA